MEKQKKAIFVLAVAASTNIAIATTTTNNQKQKTTIKCGVKSVCMSNHWHLQRHSAAAATALLQRTTLHVVMALQNGQNTFSCVLAVFDACCMWQE